MFWKDNQTASSTINSLLEDENVSLHDLLDEDDILQECKSQNKKLVEYLARPSVMYELIQLITEEQYNTELIYRYRRSAVSCEIIASRVSSISESMAGDTKVLAKLYSFLESKPPLNPLLASFFAKTLEVLLSRNTNQDWYAYQVMCLQVIEFFKSCPDFIPKLLKHLSTSAIMNCLQHVTQIPVINMKQDILFWLDSHSLIEKLISMICGSYTATEIRIAVPNVEDSASSSSILVDAVERQLEILSLDQALVSDTNSIVPTELEKMTPSEQQQTPVIESESCPTKMNPEEVKESPELPEVNAQDNKELLNQDIKQIKQEVPQVKSEEVKEIPQQPSEEIKETSKIETLVEIKETPKDIQEPTEIIAAESKECSDETKEASDETKPTPNTSISNGPTDNKVEDIMLPPKAPEVIQERILKNQAMNAAHFMSQFITNSRDPNYYSKSFTDPLYDKCISEEVIGLLLDSMFSSSTNCRRDALVYGIGVLLTLLNETSGGQQKTEQSQQNQPLIDLAEIQRIAEIILPWLPQFKQALLESPLDTKVNIAMKPVGIARLSVTNLMVVLVNTDSLAVALAMIEHKIFDILLDMFFEYKWNNFLHAYLESIVAKAFNLPEQKELYKNHLLIDCKLIERITAAWTENDNVQGKDVPRCGNMGHIIQISNLIQDCLSTSPSIVELIPIETKENWEKLVSEKLHKVNLLHDSCLGGMHPLNSTNANNDDVQHMQQTHSGYSDNVNVHDINYNDADDVHADGDVSEQTFLDMCEGTSSSMGDCHNDSPGDWTDANFPSLTGKSGLEATDGIDDDVNNMEAIDCAFYKLANSPLDHWLKQNDSHEWDDAEDIVDITPVPGLTIVNNASPWGDISDLVNDQAGWADFGLQETVGISNVPNTFTCEAFAAFDQQIPPEPPSQIMASPNKHVGPSDTQTQPVTDSQVAVNPPESEAQSATPSNPSSILTTEGMPTFADIVRHQPIGQKDITPPENTVEPKADEILSLTENKNISGNSSLSLSSKESETSAVQDSGTEPVLSRDDNANPTVPDSQGDKCAATPSVNNQR